MSITDRPNAEWPDRPDTADFRLLARILRDVDAAVEARVAGAEDNVIQSILARYVDWESLRYVANQRALRVSPLVAATGVSSDQQAAIHRMLFATWLDAFSAGAEFTAQNHLPKDGQHR